MSFLMTYKNADGNLVTIDMDGHGGGGYWVSVSDWLGNPIGESYWVVSNGPPVPPVYIPPKVNPYAISIDYFTIMLNELNKGPHVIKQTPIVPYTPPVTFVPPPVVTEAKLVVPPAHVTTNINMVPFSGDLATDFGDNFFYEPISKFVATGVFPRDWNTPDIKAAYLADPINFMARNQGKRYKANLIGGSGGGGYSQYDPSITTNMGSNSTITTTTSASVFRRHPTKRAITDFLDCRIKAVVSDTFEHIQSWVQPPWDLNAENMAEFTNWDMNSFSWNRLQYSYMYRVIAMQPNGEEVDIFLAGWYGMRSLLYSYLIQNKFGTKYLDLYPEANGVYYWTLHDFMGGAFIIPNFESPVNTLTVGQLLTDWTNMGYGNVATTHWEWNGESRYVAGYEAFGNVVNDFHGSYETTEGYAVIREDTVSTQVTTTTTSINGTTITTDATSGSNGVSAPSNATNDPQLTADLTTYVTKVKFNAFEHSFTIYDDASGVITTNTDRILYPSSIFLQSIDVVPDSYGLNGYNSVTLVDPVLFNNPIYRVDKEGNPTSTTTGFELFLNVSTRDVYYPNMALKFNFISANGFTFSYTNDEPIAEVSIGTLEGDNQVKIMTPTLTDTNGSSMNYSDFYYYLNYLVYAG